MIPQLLNYPEDVIALAATGTGKTAAFGVPLLQFAEEDPSPCQSLVLTPTRELAPAGQQRTRKHGGQSSRAGFAVVRRSANSTAD